ncbi:D-alanine--D-alanine ligase [Lichenicoccus sp.]|uniref:D-alanine--D-alanine ligase n=1 Tax=Lichenicoccus sp. TaxID=2781899 RepID=UPI003D1521F0
MSEVAVGAAAAPAPREMSRFEYWPGWLFYTPVVAWWIMLGLRHGDFSLPSAANPGISTGGLCGESKTSILDQAGPHAAAWIAPYALFRTGVDDGARALQLLQAAGLDFPLVVKPDIGCNGTGVRLLEDRSRLEATLAAFGRDVDLVLQELIAYEGEAGIFYVRRPGGAPGSITSLTHKQAPILVGDGRSSLRNLVMADSRTRLVPHLYLPRLRDRLHEVPQAGVPVRLVFAGNHCKGSIFSNGASDITAALTGTIERIMADVPNFHFGRIDVRYRSLAALRRGEDFRIIEINGVGSEATHIWDASTSLREAYRVQFAHYREAFEIGAQMRARGFSSSGVLTMLRDWRKQRRLMASYPLND